VQVSPDNEIVVVSVTWPMKPLSGVSVMVEVPGVPEAKVIVVGDAEMVKSVIEKVTVDV